MKLSPALFIFSLVPILAACGTSSGESIATSSAAVSTSPSDFALPPSDATARSQILSRYTFVDPQGIAPRGLLEDALEFFDVNRSLFPNTSTITVVDFSRFSGDNRFFVVDMTSGAVDAHKVAHGIGSDPNDTGYAQIFSNTSGSYQSSLGFYMTGSMFTSDHPNSIHLYGLSADGSPNHMANSNVYDRAILVHPATYVSDTNTGAQGRSEGCFALDPDHELAIANRIVNGSLIYAETTPLNPPIDAQPCEVPALGAGTCITTSACAADSGMVSTAGYCPGADDIECCTATK